MITFREFKYCPRCKAVLVANENYVKCAVCGFQFYDNPRSGTMLLLQNQCDEYLFFRRAEEPHKNTLDLPGGFVAAGESFLEGACRELREEANIAADDLTYYGSYADTYVYKETTYSTLSVVFTGRIRDNQILLLGDEVDEYRFFKLKDIPISDIAFSSVQHLIRDMRSSPG